MLPAILIAAAVTAPPPVSAAARLENAPAMSRAAVGLWRLSEVGGKIGCTLTLTGAPAPSGWEVKAPLACRGAFPPLKEVTAWMVDADGAIALTDSEGRRIVAFPNSTGAAAEAKAPDGKTWRLEAAGPARALTSRERMSGPFRLSGAGGASLCELTLRADIFGRAGWVTPGTCNPAWTAKRLSIWVLKDGRLTLMDGKRKPLLVMKSGEAGGFQATDPADGPVTLARR
ncbi:AprI/Inh family metalloprotease inhibitor [Caulobacter sp. KR2-114]|uniref:AprI/Inh family metalloprotease inhibitor n=1 Tax=Caulobacter sp. KR2-114 TaxID=3400912 RepID=UPI003C083330